MNASTVLSMLLAGSVLVAACSAGSPESVGGSAEAVTRRPAPPTCQECEVAVWLNGDNAWDCQPKANGTACSEGVCANAECCAASSVCDGMCSYPNEFLSDPQNCGACNRACGTNPDGVPMACSGGQCVDPYAGDAKNCGAPYRACPPGYVCASDQCKAPPPPPQPACAGAVTCTFTYSVATCRGPFNFSSGQGACTSGGEAGVVVISSPEGQVVSTVPTDANGNGGSVTIRGCALATSTPWQTSAGDIMEGTAGPEGQMGCNCPGGSCLREILFGH